MDFFANTFFQIISFFYIALMGIVFSVKKKIASAENYIFRNLIIVCLVSCVLDIVSIICAYIYPDAFATILFSKGYLLTIVAFCIIYTEYSIIITNTTINNEQKLEQYYTTMDFVINC